MTSFHQKHQEERATDRKITNPVGTNEIVPVLPSFKDLQMIVTSKAKVTEKKIYPFEITKIPCTESQDIARYCNPKTKELDNSCQYRNVQKSIIRRMSSYVHDKEEIIISILLNRGFSKIAIDNAFLRINSYKKAEHKTGNKKMTPQLIEKACTNISIYTYILKEALIDMLNDWNSENYGKLAERNIEAYKEICMGYYKRVNSLLTEAKL